MLQIATLWISSISYIYCIYLLISILSLDWQTYHYFWPCFFRKKWERSRRRRRKRRGRRKRIQDYEFHIYVCLCVCVCARACVLSVLSRVWLCDPMDWSLPGSSVHGIFQARILEWVAISWSRGSSQPRKSNLCLLHLLQWQANSLPLQHLGSPYVCV